VQGEQFAPRAPLNRRRKSACHFRPEQPLGLCARKAQNHWGILTRCVNSVKTAGYPTRALCFNNSLHLQKMLPQLLRPNVWAIVRLVMRGPTTVFLVRGASPPRWHSGKWEDS
jgi:hypothetical protein